MTDFATKNKKKNPKGFNYQRKIFMQSLCQQDLKRTTERFASCIEQKQILDIRNGWVDDFRFNVLFNSISVISGRCLDDNERLCAMELGLRMR